MTRGNEMADKTAKLKRLEEIDKSSYKLGAAETPDAVTNFKMLQKDFYWVIDELKLAWEKIGLLNARTRSMERILDEWNNCGCIIDCNKCWDGVVEALSEVRKMRGESE